MAQQTLAKPIFRPKTPKTPRGIPKSLIEAIMDEADRFTKGVRNNSKVVDFATFVQELKKAMNRNNSYPYIFNDLDMEILRVLFRSNSIKRTIANNIGQDNADVIYKAEEQSASPLVIAPSVQQTILRTPIIVKLNV